MRRVVFFALIIQIFVSGRVLFAQGEPQATHEFGRRAAKIAQTDADTGLLFNEGKLEIERQRWHDDVRTSGEVKDINEVRRRLRRIFRLGYRLAEIRMGIIQAEAAILLSQAPTLPIWQPAMAAFGKRRTSQPLLQHGYL
jgi:hypothetical protein